LRDETESTALHLAAAAATAELLLDNLVIIQLLVDGGAVVSAVDYEGNTPLQLVVSSALDSETLGQIQQLLS
jgi:ankyrin repeat protein